MITVDLPPERKEEAAVVTEEGGASNRRGGPPGRSQRQGRTDYLEPLLNVGMSKNIEFIAFKA